jgi:hypothetical protein
MSQRQSNNWPGNEVCSVQLLAYNADRFCRFILADTDRLHKKITEMSDRIRQLEDALAILQSGTTRETHPLLRADLLAIKSGLELHSATNSGFGGQQTEQELDEESQDIDAFGTLAVRDDGAATFYGRSAGSEVCTEFCVHRSDILKCQYLPEFAFGELGISSLLVHTTPETATYIICLSICSLQKSLLHCKPV